MGLLLLSQDDNMNNMIKVNYKTLPKWARHALPGYELAQSYGFDLVEFEPSGTAALYKRGDLLAPISMLCSRDTVELFLYFGDLTITTGKCAMMQSIGWKLIQLDGIRDKLIAQ